ncbi:5-hydroxytryptamine receptor 3A-like [Branchiostoma floridae]|uniref:5-hydroxytryptamine receptor 3A-like n=1 Tax=Branchiostoma floridae TaxID=7739 RepID=A0A9J7LE14_BRAFL|nr:5-hydroxytryptamine receptor 3A-like [Branchiostoma floridae]
MDCHVCFSAIAAVEQTISEWYRNEKIFAKDNREACFVVHLERIPLFHIATTVGPCIILVVLMIITFVMPLDRGDRISFATLIIVYMALMGLFIFFTMAVIVIHDRKGSLPPTAKIIFLRHISRILLLGDLTEERHPRDGEDGPTCFPAIELTNCAFQSGDKVEVSDEISYDDNDTTRQPSSPLAGLEATSYSVLLKLISNFKGVKNDIKELAKAVDNKREVLMKLMKNEEGVSEYILLAKVLDRLCLVLYIISIVAAVPMTMYIGT